MEEFVPIFSSSAEHLLDEIVLLLEKDSVPTIKHYTGIPCVYVSKDWVGRALAVVYNHRGAAKTRVAPPVKVGRAF